MRAAEAVRPVAGELAFQDDAFNDLYLFGMGKPFEADGTQRT